MKLGLRNPFIIYLLLRYLTSMAYGIPPESSKDMKLDLDHGMSKLLKRIDQVQGNDKEITIK